MLIEVNADEQVGSYDVIRHLADKVVDNDYSIERRRKSIQEIITIADDSSLYVLFNGFNHFTILNLLKTTDELQQEACALSKKIANTFVMHMDISYQLMQRSLTTEQTIQMLNPLLDILMSAQAESEEKVVVLIVLWGLSRNERNKTIFALPELGLLNLLIGIIKSDHGELQAKAVGVLRAVSMTDDNGKLLVSAELDLIDTLVHILKTNEGEARINTLQVISNAAFTPENQVLLVNPTLKLLPALVHLVQTTEDETLDKTIGLLQNLSMDNDNKILLSSLDLGLLTSMKEVLKTGNADNAIKCLSVLWNMSVHPVNQRLFIAPPYSLLPLILEHIRKGGSAAKKYGLGVLWHLCEAEENVSIIMGTNIFADVIACIKDVGGYPNISPNGNSVEFHSIMCIYAMTGHEESRARFRQLEAPAVLGPMMEFDSFYGLVTSLSYVFLFGRDENGPHAELLRSGLKVMNSIIELFVSVIQGTDGIGYKNGVFKLYPVLLAVAELSISDVNKKQLAIPKVRDLLLKVIADVKTPTLVNSRSMGAEYRLKCAEVAGLALLQLSFLTEANDELSSPDGFFPASSDIHEQLAEYVGFIKSDGAGPVDLLVKRLTKKEPVLFMHTCTTTSSHPHLMLSYCGSKYAKPSLVNAFADEMRGLGYEMWRDVDGSASVPPMSGGSMVENMAEAIDHSQFVIICVSREYKMSCSCRLEAMYSMSRAKANKLKIIYLMMQEDYTTVSTPKSIGGYLGVMMESALWCPMWSQEQVSYAALSVAGLIRRDYEQQSIG